MFIGAQPIPRKNPSVENVTCAYYQHLGYEFKHCPLLMID
jgi:hypothetical protein